MDSILLSVERLTVTISGKEILRNISLEIKKDEQWAVFGPAGSGKTVLAQCLSGNRAFQGRLNCHETDGTENEKAILMVDQQHRFRDLQNQSNFYYQQRYNAFDSETTRTVAEDLAAFEQKGNSFFSKQMLLDTFHLSDLLNEPLIQLSNGENKRIQILKAVLSTPYILILDEPYTGLDEEGRQMLDGILQTLTLSGQPIILFSSRNHVPACFNTFALLEHGMLSVKATAEEIRIDRSIGSRNAVKEFPSAITFSYPAFKHAVRMCDVHIRYDGRNILEGITWEINRGSCWALTGHNGAGKTTLLSLITADNPQAYANEIYLFDRKRGSGESIWEIKQKIGYLSPELQLYFDPAATAFTAIASGLFDTIGLFRQLTVKQEELVSAWLQFLDCKSYAHRLLNSLPAGIQRLILMGRTMIKTPPLLILDEPCQGLDATGTAFVLEMIDRYCALYGASLIFVSHYAADFPGCIRQTLRLEKGRMI